MKVLIITYYWPPAGGSGVQRWLKFVKYLQDFGIEPIVYTVDNPNYALTDEFLQKEVPDNIQVIKQPIFEPNTIFSFFKKKNKKTSAGFLAQKPGVINKIMHYVRANYFIPDARKFWIKPSVNYLSTYLKKNPVSAIITTGPPHSLHIIGYQLRKQLNVKWLADFRDPWTDIDYFHHLPLSKKAKEKHFKLEKTVLETADITMVVGETMKRNYQKYTDNIHVITNGFDTQMSTDESTTLDTKFTLTHIGLMNADRNPTILWKVLDQLCKEIKGFSDDLEVVLVGSIAEEVNNELNGYNNISVDRVGYLPHKEVQFYQRKSQVLLLSVNNVPSAKGIITGKIFEYLQAKRPILAIGPTDGDLAAILNKTQSGVIVNFDDIDNLKVNIQKLYEQYKNNTLTTQSVNISSYHRKKLTEQLANIIKQTVNS